MILDIEGREINVGDECYMPSGNTLLRIKIVKETRMQFQYNWRYVKAQEYKSHFLATSNKSSNAAGHLIKVC